VLPGEETDVLWPNEMRRVQAVIPSCMDRHRSLAAQGKRDCASALMRRMRR